MNRKTLNNIIFTVWLFLLPVIQPVQAEDIANPEYQIKAAFLYNFLKFVEWPDSKTNNGDEPIMISIIGKDVFQDTFENIKDKTIEGKKVIVKRFKGVSELQNNSPEEQSQEHPQIEAIRKSHLLFICPSEKKHIANILKSVKGHGVLTVADTEGFLETGGIINLLMEEKKVRFEINFITAKQEDIQIRSQLLRLAKRIIRQETSSIDTNQPFVVKQTVPYKAHPKQKAFFVNTIFFPASFRHKT